MLASLKKIVSPAPDLSEAKARLDRARAAKSENEAKKVAAKQEIHNLRERLKTTPPDALDAHGKNLTENIADVQRRLEHLDRLGENQIGIELREAQLAYANAALPSATAEYVRTAGSIEDSALALANAMAEHRDAREILKSIRGTLAAAGQSVSKRPDQVAYDSYEADLIAKHRSLTGLVTIPQSYLSLESLTITSNFPKSAERELLGRLRKARV